jgi:2-phosphosulfolactate phosphatase
MKSITTVLSPALFEATVGSVENKNVVVIDILRATTTMCVAMENGANSIWPVDSVQKAAQAGSSFLTAGERNGEKVEGFDLGNSPQEFTEEVVKGRDIVMTTTNGTRAIALSEGAKNIYISSYRNVSAMIKELVEQPEDVVLFCSGWKDQVNLEDALFAGEVINGLQDSAISYQLSAGSGQPTAVSGQPTAGSGQPTADGRQPIAADLGPLFNDSSILAHQLFLQVNGNDEEFLQQASHVQRFKSLHIESDLEVCLKRDTGDFILKVENGIIRRM